jgi:hypothetical protein
MLGKFHSQPNGIVVLERLPASSQTTNRQRHERDATLAEYLAYLTEPDTTEAERSFSRPVAPRFNRVQVQSNRRAAQLPAELPKLTAELNAVWRELRRQLALAARLSA